MRLLQAGRLEAVRIRTILAQNSAFYLVGIVRLLYAC